jgi:hypothetical protein
VIERHNRTQADLVDQLFNSSEKRLARALLVLSRVGKEAKTETVIPRVSQETLAEMVGTTRGRVNFFMNKFRKLGFIDYNGGLQVNSSLLTVCPARVNSGQLPLSPIVILHSKAICSILNIRTTSPRGSMNMTIEAETAAEVFCSP